MINQGKAESVLKYVYSEGKQLKAIESEEGNITYKYNKQGNVISKTTKEQTETFEYTGFNQQVEEMIEVFKALCQLFEKTIESNMMK